MASSARTTAAPSPPAHQRLLLVPDAVEKVIALVPERLARRDLGDGDVAVADAGAERCEGVDDLRAVVACSVTCLS